MDQDSIVSYTTKAPLLVKSASGIEQISLVFACDKKFQNQSQKKIREVNNHLYFYYKGIESCGYKYQGPLLEFRKLNYLAIALTIVSALNLVLKRWNEKLAFAIAGGEVGVLLALLLIAEIEEHLNIPEVSIYIFYAAALVGGLLLVTGSIYSFQSAVTL